MSEPEKRWQGVLHDQEEIRWEGRPAPRCYTFRHWRHSVFGAIFFVLCLAWQVYGISMASNYATVWPAILPIPFLLAGAYFAIGPLLLARLEWDNVYYAITDRRLLVQRGLRKASLYELELSELTYFSLQRYGEELGTLRVYKGEELVLVLHCLEHPGHAVDLLKAAITANTPIAAEAPPE